MVPDLALNPNDGLNIAYNLSMDHGLEPIYYSTRCNLPSEKRLKEAFPQCDPKLIRALLTGKVDLMTSKAARDRHIQAYNPHRPYVYALEALNEHLGAYGVEYVAHKDDTFTVSFGFEYLNFGDTYDTTLILDLKSGKWSIGSYGDKIERAREGTYL